MHRITITAVAAALLLTACASAPETTGDPSSVPTTSSPTSTSTPSSSTATGIEVSGDLGSKPNVTIADDFTSTEQLVVQDLVEGTGAAVQASDMLTVHYVGIGGLSHQQFDSSWDRGETAQFPLSGVIQGWQEGLLGMKVGGRRLLVIPGNLAYGAGGSSDGSIQPNETLIFVVDLISIP